MKGLMTKKKPETKERPIKKAGYSQAKAQARKERKRHEAALRQAKHNALTPAQKLAKAKRWGSNTREVKRLEATQV